MEKNYEFSLESIKKISIKTAWPQIEINTDNGNSIRLMITGDDASVSTIDVEEKDGELIVEQPHFGLNKSFLQVSWTQLLLIVPNAYNKPLDISSISGSCIVAGYHGESLEIEMVSGDIKLHDIETNELRLKQVSGNITSELTKAHELKIRTVSGKTNFKDLSINKLSSNNVSGVQELYITNEFESLDFISVSGNIKIYQIYDAVNVNVRAVSNALVMENVSFKDCAPKISVNVVSAKIVIGRNNK